MYSLAIMHSTRHALNVSVCIISSTYAAHVSYESLKQRLLVDLYVVVARVLSSSFN